MIEGVFPGRVDTTVTDRAWVPAHADFNWSNLKAPECWILDWEGHGLAPRGLDAATLWADSLSVPELAAQVQVERQADLDSRPGRLMALFNCAKILTDSGGGPTADAAAREAERLIASLQL